MEGIVSHELTQTPEPQSSQDLDSSSQVPAANTEEEKDDKDQGDAAHETVENTEKTTDTPGEVRKTWGFRRTTIAKRDMAGEMAGVAGSPDTQGTPVRRSGRQAKRTDKLEEFLVTVKRGRGGRRSAPAQLEIGDPLSETASEASFDGSVDPKGSDSKPPSPVRRTRGRGRRKVASPKVGTADSFSEGDSSENEEESLKDKTETETGAEDCMMEVSLNEILQDSEKHDDEKKEDSIEDVPANRRLSRSPAKAGTTKDAKLRTGPKRLKDSEEEDDESSSSDTDSDYYDPNALYCICRQKHNKRFMICCDRCEEWFHGDCVGITEARGRLMERNGEDYVCPNCTGKKSQSARPSVSTAVSENGKPTVTALGGAFKPESGPLPASQAAMPTNTTNATTTVAAEEKEGNDLGIKGRIEKATNPSGKKKIKIFQPVMQTAEESSLPKCIGPGCERDAQPDSVYCGNDCILKHAAAAMKTITTDSKETKPKDKAKAQKKPTPKSTLKTSDPERRITRRSTGSVSKAQEDSSEPENHRQDADDTDEEDRIAEEHPPPPAMSSWSSDHNYIAVAPEKTTPISPSVLNKASAPMKEEEEKEKKEETEPEKKEVPPVEKKPTVTAASPKGGKKSPVSKTPKSAPITSPKRRLSSTPTSSTKDSKKQHLSQNKAKKQGPPPPPIPVFSSSGPPGSRIHPTGALSVTKSTFTIPKKHSQTGVKESSGSGSSPTSKKPPVPVSSTIKSQPPVSKPVQSSVPALPPQPTPNNQMRSNIRRSLTDILYKRVSDSDDLSMSESEVGKLAFTIEKEMFNLCMNTDNKYKNKYRTLMFNLKDPKNKGLFYRVIGGALSPFRLVRLSPEELLSKDIFEWRKTDPAEISAAGGKSQSGQFKAGSKQETPPADVDMEEAPSISDGDDNQESRPSAPPQSSGSAAKNSAVPDILSMFKDTTAEHRAHLFDLNCKICTGQKSADDEPAAKKPKLSVPKKQDIPIPEKPATELPAASQSGSEAPMPNQPSSMGDTGSAAPVVQAPLVNPVSSVTISRRDPRMASHRSTAPVAQAEPVAVAPAAPGAPITVPYANIVPSEAAVVENKVQLPLPPVAPLSLPKTKAESRHYGASASSTAEPPPEGETALFLSGQEMLWKGFINMHSVAKFVTKAYLVSGSFEHLKEDLPDTIHIGGRILPHTVWDYVGKLKTSVSKELCLIRFHPATEEEEVAYVSLFSYFSSRKRFGVVANNNKRIKDLYLIPLSSTDPLPAKLLPFDGPGLEPARPNLLLGLLICQKDKKRPGAPLESEEKRSKTQRDDETGLPKAIPVSKADVRTSLEPMSTTPPGTPPPLSSSESSVGPTGTSASSVFSILSSIKAPGVTASTSSNSPLASTATATASSATPLQTILKTLFGKKTQDSEASQSPSDNSADAAFPLLDPIVEQFGIINKGKKVAEEEDDRPYDPEEEYDPNVAFGTENSKDSLLSISNKQEEVKTSVDDVEYDPEDDSIFDEVKSDPGSKKQTEEQVELSQQQQQPEDVVSVPAKSLLASSQLLQLGKSLVEDLATKSSSTPVINLRRDPRQSRDHRQAAGFRTSTDSAEKEESPAVTSNTASTTITDTTTVATLITDNKTLEIAAILDTLTSQQPKAVDTSVQHTLAVDTTEPCASTSTDTPTQDDADVDSQQLHPPAGQSETSKQEEEPKNEEEPSEEMESSEICIPLLGEKIDPELVESYIDTEPEASSDEKDEKDSSENQTFEKIWPNSASILKSKPLDNQVSPMEDSAKSSSPTYYNISTISTPITSISQPQDITQAGSSYMDSHGSHMPQRIPSNSQAEYRGPSDIPPPVSFPPPSGPPPMLGPQQQMGVPPPLHISAPVTGPPPMSGPPPMQIPPPMQMPPPMQGLRPPHGETDLSRFPPPRPYLPYQNQWGNSQQFDASRGPPLPVITPRGPPPQIPPMGQQGPPPPQIFNSNIPPHHIAPHGPPPGLPPSGPPRPPFDGQRFNAPPPPFNFPGPRGPPPPFASPPLGHFENRAPQPHFLGPRGPPPSHNIGEPGSLPNIPRGPGDQDIGGYQQGMEPPHAQAGPAFRAPPPNHFDGRRGPPGSAGDLPGHRFPPPNQFHSSTQHREPFEDSRGGTQDFERHRGPAPQHFGGPRVPPPGPYSDINAGGPPRYQLNDHPNDIRPIRGPLLPTPPESHLNVMGHMGGHSPDSHRDEHWRRRSPEMRRRSSSTREGSEPQEGALREDIQEDRRRDRDRDGPHGGPSRGWNRDREWNHGRERSRERDRERDHRDREGDKEFDRSRERGRDRERDRGRETERSRERGRDRDRSRDRDSRDSRETDRGRDTERHREDGDKKRDRDRDRDRERDRDRGRERESDRKEHDKDRAKNRDRDRDRDRDRERDRDRHSRDKRRERSRSRERERGKDRDRRDRDRDRERDRERRDRSRSKDRKEEKKERSETVKDTEKSPDTEVTN